MYDIVIMFGFGFAGGLIIFGIAGILFSIIAKENNRKTEEFTKKVEEDYIRKEVYE